MEQITFCGCGAEIPAKERVCSKCIQRGFRRYGLFVGLLIAFATVIFVNIFNLQHQTIQEWGLGMGSEGAETHWNKMGVTALMCVGFGVLSAYVLAFKVVFPPSAGVFIKRRVRESIELMCIGLGACLAIIVWVVLGVI